MTLLVRLLRWTAPIALLVLVGCSAGQDTGADAEPEGSERPSDEVQDAPPRPDDDHDESVVTAATPQPTPVPLEPSDLDREIPEEGNTAETFGQLGETEVEFETDEGSVQIGSGDVPGGAAEFPVPEDLEVQLASETETDLGFSGVTALSFAELVAFYSDGLPAAGYEIRSSQQTDEVFAVFTFESADELGQVAISQAPGFDGWTVLVSIGDGEGEEEQLPGGEPES